MAKARVFLGISVEAIKQWIGWICLATIHMLNAPQQSVSLSRHETDCRVEFMLERISDGT